MSQFDHDFWSFLIAFLSIFDILVKIDQIFSRQVQNELISKIYVILQIFKNSPFLSIWDF